MFEYDHVTRDLGKKAANDVERIIFQTTALVDCRDQKAMIATRALAAAAGAAAGLHVLAAGMKPEDASPYDIAIQILQHMKTFSGRP